MAINASMTWLDDPAAMLSCICPMDLDTYSSIETDCTTHMQRRIATCQLVNAIRDMDNRNVNAFALGCCSNSSCMLNLTLT